MMKATGGRRRVQFTIPHDHRYKVCSFEIQDTSDQPGYGGYGGGSTVAWLLYSVLVGAHRLGSHCLPAACNMFVFVSGAQDGAATSSAAAAPATPSNVTWRSVHDERSCVLLYCSNIALYQIRGPP